MCISPLKVSEKWKQPEKKDKNNTDFNELQPVNSASCVRKSSTESKGQVEGDWARSQGIH